MKMEESAACAQVSAMEFVAVCGGCDPVPLRVESMETFEGSISSLNSAEKNSVATVSVLLAVVVTATISLLLGCGGGLKLGMVRGGKLPFSSGRARTSISEMTVEVRE